MKYTCNIAKRFADNYNPPQWGYRPLAETKRRGGDSSRAGAIRRSGAE
jgi:hypothetical protein